MLKLKKDLALELLYSSGGVVIGGYRKIQDYPGDIGRWTQWFQFTIQDAKGDYWSTDHEEGLTEMQEYSSWDGVDEVSFYPSEPVQVTYTMYRTRST